MDSLSRTRELEDLFAAGLRGLGPAEADMRVANRARPLRIAEAGGSAGLSGCAYPADAVEALVERGYVAAGPLADALVITGLAAGVRAVAKMAHARRPLFTVEEIRALHRVIAGPLALYGTGNSPGSWRRTNLPAFPSGMVPTPPWLIPQEMNALADRFGITADRSPVITVARMHERIMRIQPFEDGNGRVGRLLVNLVLRRLGYPPWTPGRLDGTAYRRALAAADGGELGPLALLIARGVAANAAEITAPAGASPVRPLVELSGEDEYEALRKAVARDRLDHVRRDGGIMTTRAWIDLYRRTRAQAGRRRKDVPAG